MEDVDSKYFYSDVEQGSFTKTNFDGITTMSVGDWAAILTLVGAIGFGLWNWVIPWCTKKVQQKWFTWPVKVELVRAMWTPAVTQDGDIERRDTNISIHLRFWPRKFTTNVMSSPTLLGFSATVNGVIPEEFERSSTKFLGRGISRSQHVTVSVSWTTNDLDVHNSPTTVNLNFDVEPPVGELRKISIEVPIEENFRAGIQNSS